MITIITLNEENICTGPASVAREDGALWLAGFEDGQGSGGVSKDLKAFGGAGKEL